MQLNNFLLHNNLRQMLECIVNQQIRPTRKTLESIIKVILDGAYGKDKDVKAD